MEEIIQEIAKIDTRIRVSKSQSEERIEARRKYYEMQMKIYETERIKEANERSEELYKNILVGAEQQAQFEEEKAKQMALLVENRYLQAEETILDALFNKLFIVEG